MQQFLIEKYSLTSGFIESANTAMENSKSAVFSKIGMTENIPIISGVKNTSVWKIIAMGVTMFAVSGGVLAMIKYSDFDSFVKHTEINNEMNVSSVSFENNFDTDIIDTKSSDTDNSYGIDKIADIVATKDSADSVWKISSSYSTDTDKNKSSPSSSVSKQLSKLLFYSDCNGKCFFGSRFNYRLERRYKQTHFGKLFRSAEQLRRNRNRK